MLQLKEIKKNYFTASETVEALKGINISFRQKEFVSILGPSGCGKTTLLNIIGGLDHYSSGDLVIRGRSTNYYSDRDWDVYRNHRIGFIFQSYNLIPHQTVLGNVELALTISGVSKEERRQRAKRALDRVGLAGQYNKRPNQLSGGQCQRVAIARALVNDPEILLADEPTGALDTVTSKQIMDLIKEISGERLVIMVTHNPEIADEYSSRIIRLLDGRVIEDTNPFSAEDEELECAEAAKAEAAAEIDAPILKDGKKKPIKKEKAKMSFFTAFMLSARNLISKKGRTAMVGFAGSIGIIGIALVLAFSAGIKGYIASMQDDMLSGNPIEIAETAYDLSALTGMMDASSQKEIIDKLPGRVYVSSLVEYLAKMNKDIQSIVMENDLTKEYIDFVKAMPKEYYNAMLLGYGLDMSMSIYTDFKYSEGSEEKNLSVKNLVDMYTAILKGTDFADYASYVTALTPTFQQSPNNPDYLLSQYDLVGEGSKIATEAGEVMLVLNGDDELSDLLLAMLGYYNQEQFEEIIHKATSEDGSYDEGLYRNYFTYEELLGKSFTWYPNNTIFEKTEYPLPTGGTLSSFGYKPTSESFSSDGAITLKVVGILTTKENVSYGSLSSGIYYTEALTEKVLEANLESDIVNYIKDDAQSAALAQSYYYMPYSYSYVGWDGETKTAMGTVGPAMQMSDMMGGAFGGENEIDPADMKERFIRGLGGNDIANSVLIYPLSFDDKDYVTNYLDLWNGDGDITYGDITIKAENRADVTYTDALELIISLINTMIDVVSYALIAFTSVSLVVSTVMIGIITYVSVVERIKEIGVIRSLGGRKKDVRHLFNAETFIIGLLAGAIGIGVTYIISAVVNLILGPIISYSSIAALPIGQAALLVALSIGLTLISGLIPASSAAKKDPVVALRTE